MLYSCRERGNRSERERKMKHDRAEVQSGYSAEEVLNLLKELLICYLEELKDARASGENSFVYGEQTAYTECVGREQFCLRRTDGLYRMSGMDRIMGRRRRARTRFYHRRALSAVGKKSKSARPGFTASSFCARGTEETARRNYRI